MRAVNETDSQGHPPEAHTVLECLHVILDENSRYANRDLDVLQARQP